MDWTKTTARWDEKYLIFEIWCDWYKGFYGSLHVFVLYVFIQKSLEKPLVLPGQFTAAPSKEMVLSMFEEKTKVGPTQASYDSHPAVICGV